MVQSSKPIFFSLSEDSYLVAFLYAAITAAVTTSLVVEYRLINPFGSYIDSIPVAAETTFIKRCTHILQTAAVAFTTTLMVLVMLHVFFSLGDAMVKGSS